MEGIPKRKRASKPKVRTGCITCKIRRVKCDETRPQCLRCTRTGRECDGYVLQVRPLNLVIEPSPSVATASSTEQRALEFFYQKTSPQLSGFFTRSFWRGCVLQLSLTEPCVRHAIAAMGVLHESQAFRRINHDEAVSSALTLYNEAIHAAVQRPAHDPSGSLPVLIISSIIFTCFEFLRENSVAALSHIKSGINLLNSSRSKARGEDSHRPWGEPYPSFEKTFLETELAPILATLYITTSNHDRSRSDIGVLLNPVGKDGVIDFGNSFETVHQARTALIDLLCTSLDLARLTDQERVPAEKLKQHFDHLKIAHAKWKVLFDDFVARRSETWSKEESRAADHNHMMWYSIKTGFTSSFADSETAWDDHKADFEEILRLAESLVSEPQQSSGNTQRELSSEVGFLASVYIVAWKCRWPPLRRQALDIMLKAPMSECTTNSRIYHAVYARIMEIEEAACGLPPDMMISQDLLPPESARVYQYYGSPHSTGDGDIYEITFLTRPNGPDGDLHYHEELLDLSTVLGEAESTLPSPLPALRLGSRKSDGATRRMLNILNSAAARSLP